VGHRGININTVGHSSGGLLIVGAGAEVHDAHVDSHSSEYVRDGPHEVSVRLRDLDCGDGSGTVMEILTLGLRIVKYK